MPSSLRPDTAPAQVGRFVLRQELGRGAQATVWLAHDPRLERDVAIKLLHQATGGAAAEHWLDEARAVSRLKHPHIVPVFEADVHQGRPYLVFEHVAGGTLAQLMHQGPVALRAALSLGCGMLDALQVAHDAGVVHRDLKPSNILLDSHGRARVMDFGIAARLNAPAGSQRPAGEIVGSPGYMSPEAARGESPSASMDVYAAAVILAEMLSGQSLRPRHADPWQAVRLAAERPIVLPDFLGERVDARLRAVLSQALAHHPGERTPSAHALREALLAWQDQAQGHTALVPARALTEPPTADPSRVGAAQGALEFLWRRMRHKADFPTLGDSVARIHRMASSERESLAGLSAEIMKDVALTQKLLRLVNSASFASAGGGTIQTVSRAVALVGFANIRNMALSLVLLEHMRDKQHAQQLTLEFLRALMAAQLAGELSHTAREREESFIGALFVNLGRLLAGFYFPEEAAEVRDQLRRVGETAAAIQVLGLSYEELGLGVARRWGLPDTLLHAMQRPPGEPPQRPADLPAERQRWLAAAANDIAEQLLLGAEPGVTQQRLQRLTERYGRALQIQPDEVTQAVAHTREQLSDFILSSSLTLPPTSPVRSFLAHAEAEAETGAGTEPPGPQSSGEATVTQPAAPASDRSHDATVRLPARVVASPSPERVQTLLAAGVADIAQTMASEQFRLNEVLRRVLDTMMSALDCSRVVFCLRDPRLDALTGRLALGMDANTIGGAFRIPLRSAPGQVPDLFSAICRRAADTLIADAHVTSIARSLPPWFVQQVRAGTFVILPMTMKQTTFAMIYADRTEAGSLMLGESELTMLRTLRNQAVMAFRQAA